MAEMVGPNAPEGSREAGRRLWCSVVEEFDLEEHELALLREATRTVDLLDELDATVRRDGAVIVTAEGHPRAHPAAIEARQQRIALARVLSALRMPSGDEPASRPQRRVGVRGTYATGGGAPRMRRVS